jgi:hypothetical protein
MQISIYDSLISIKSKCSAQICRKTVIGTDPVIIRETMINLVNVENWKGFGKMSESRFMLLIGRGNAYVGDGIHPDALLSFFDDKDVWVFSPLYNIRDDNIRRRVQDDRHIVDDAFLMITAYVLAPWSREQSRWKRIGKEARNCFEKDEPVPESLYEGNKTIYRDINLKIVALLLGTASLKIGGTPLSCVRDQFLRAVENDYPITNLEICASDESMFRHYGNFDQA